MSKKTYENRKEKGICVKCGKEKALPDRVMCAVCAEKSREYREKNREFFKSMGLCPRCGKNKLFGDEKECPECNAKMYEINKRSRQKRNFDAKAYYRKDIQMLKQNGLCRSCRHRKVAEGHTYCSICLAKKRERSKETRRKEEKAGLDKSERPNYGMCYTCGSPLDRDGRVCRKCAETLTKNLPVYRNNEFWRNDNKLVFRSN